MAKTKVVTMESDIETTPKEEVVVEVPKKGSSKKQVINGVATVNVSYNNTIISIADSIGQIIAFSSAGLLGFKGSKKSTPYAANMVAKDCFEKTKKFNLTNIKIVIKGVGPGRESAIRGLAGTGLNVLSIMDATPIAHNGVRRPKPRRI